MIRLPLILVLAAGAAATGADPAPPRTRVTSCTTSECHTTQLDHPFLHGPTAVSACDACHDYVDPTAHTFTLKREGRDLCLFCHIDKKGSEGPFVHKPMADGQCLSCHDPHGAHTRELLRKPTVNAVCLDCHTDTMHGSVAHAPAAENCTVCHESHTASHASLLRTAPRDLCASCHEDVFKAIGSMAHPHQPAEADCLTCHSPHATDSMACLKAPPKDLCLSCHAEVGRTISAATHPHTATTDERACLNCHSAHASDHEQQLLKDTIATCLDCHAKPIKVAENRIVPGVPELAKEGYFLHGPVKLGDCSACHTVHGGSLGALLVEPYPASFYQTYTDDAYALCFKCHDKELMHQTDGPNQTRFRDGDRNLHAVHVTSGPQGRSCRACHAVHASQFESLMANQVTFGQWKLPINYQPTPTGGSCAPGCHKPETYNRDHPSATPLNEPEPAAPLPVDEAADPSR